MGSEIYVYAKPKNSNELATIYWTSRSSEFYQVMQHQCGYELIKPLTESMIEDAEGEIRAQKEMYNQQIFYEQQAIEVLKTTTDSIKDKMEYLQCCIDSITELTEEIDELELILQYFTFLKHSLSGGAQLYIGIDTGDILEE